MKKLSKNNDIQVKLKNERRAFMNIFKKLPVFIFQIKSRSSHQFDNSRNPALSGKAPEGIKRFFALFSVILFLCLWAGHFNVYGQGSPSWAGPWILWDRTTRMEIKVSG